MADLLAELEFIHPEGEAMRKVVRNSEGQLMEVSGGCWVGAAGWMATHIGCSCQLNAQVLYAHQCAAKRKHAMQRHVARRLVPTQLDDFDWPGE